VQTAGMATITTHSCSCQTLWKNATWKSETQKER